jgi:Arc/MetJ-type ribon-helix-helix transcriptional regulator
MAKLSISLGDSDVRWLKSRARLHHRGNLSSAVAEAVRVARQNEAMHALLDDLGAPELTLEEVDEVMSELEGRQASKKSRRRTA